MTTHKTTPSYILVTGANGEFGHGLIKSLHQQDSAQIVALDLHDLDAELKQYCANSYAGDILEKKLLDHIFAAYDISEVYHLAALLSTSAERAPETACEVNVMGTMALLRHSMQQARTSRRRVKFMFPSSIAVYGMPDLETKHRAGKISEDRYLTPSTMYGCNKLACEHLGIYYTYHYKQLDRHDEGMAYGVDFRCIRFPGVISAFTMPTGGTSDYAPEMIHAAAQGRAYDCFVREDARIPFITMPEAIEALLKLSGTGEASLTRRVYNIGGFSPSADQIAGLVRETFSKADTRFVPDLQRQGIVDTWPEDVDDSAARKDWGYKPNHTLESAFADYLAPNIAAAYA